MTAKIIPHKRGRVSFQGSWWFARCDQEITLLPGEKVYVIERENLTLIVVPAICNSCASYLEQFPVPQKMG